MNEQLSVQGGKASENRINWKRMVRHILDNCFMSQEELADCCGISQQCISSWLNESRRPGEAYKRTLLAFASGKGIDARFYEIDSNTDALRTFLEERNSDEFARILSLYAVMPEKKRRKLVDYAILLHGKEKAARANLAKTH